MRLLPAALVLAIMGCAIAGIGMGQAPAEREPAPSRAAVAAAEQRLTAAGANAMRGRELFEEQGCDRCHSIAAVDAGGKLGPRLDTLDDDLDDIAESIAEPRDEVEDDYPERLMPDDFARRMSDVDLATLARFVALVSGGEREDRGDDRDAGDRDDRGRDRDDRGDDRGRGRGRGRRSG